MQEVFPLVGVIKADGFADFQVHEACVLVANHVDEFGSVVEAVFDVLLEELILGDALDELFEFA